MASTYNDLLAAEFEARRLRRIIRACLHEWEHGPEVKAYLGNPNIDPEVLKATLSIAEMEVRGFNRTCSKCGLQQHTVKLPNDQPCEWREGFMPAGTRWLP